MNENKKWGVRLKAHALFPERVSYSPIPRSNEHCLRIFWKLADHHITWYVQAKLSKRFLLHKCKEFLKKLYHLRQEGYVFVWFVCLSVCLSDYLMKRWTEVCFGPRNNRLHFGEDSDYDTDTGSGLWLEVKHCFDLPVWKTTLWCHSLTTVVYCY